jgi:polyisoprenoid-binding protein YceI
VYIPVTRRPDGTVPLIQERPVVETSTRARDGTRQSCPIAMIRELVTAMLLGQNDDTTLWTGAATHDPDTPVGESQTRVNSRGEIRASAASLSTGQERRDDHLRSADFLDAEHYPWVVATATAIEPLGDRYRVQVDLTIRDQTRSVALEGEFLGFYPAMSGGGRRAGFHFETQLSRKDWGITWNMALEAGGWLVGDEIRLEIDVAADEVAAVVAGA